MRWRSELDPTPGGLRVAYRPGGERRLDPPVPPQEICAPIDLPRPGAAVRCKFREGLHRLPDPYISESIRTPS
jgi:hypothetical protein